MALGQGDGELRKDEETRCATVGIEHSMCCNAIQIVTLEVLREMLVRDATRISRV